MWRWPAARAEITGRRIGWLLGAAVVAGVFVAGGMRQAHRPRVPQHLVGVWKTDDPRYAGRTLEITRTEVRIVQEPKGQPVMGKIEKIERASPEFATTFTFYTRDAMQSEDRMVFRFDPEGGGTIKFKNQGTIWRREEDLRQ